MTARVYLHPRTVEYIGLYSMVLRMKDRGYEVDTALSPRFFVAVPEPPGPRPPPTPPHVGHIERRARTIDLWWPRT